MLHYIVSVLYLLFWDASVILTWRSRYTVIRIFLVLHFPCRLWWDDSVLHVGVECVECTFCGWSVSDSFQKQSTKTLTQSPYLNWNQFSLTWGSWILWMQMQCIKSNRSLLWLMYGNCVCIIRTVYEPPLCRDEKRIEFRKKKNRENWKYGESWQDNPQSPCTHLSSNT
jgi:hypothetical protein